VGVGRGGKTSFLLNKGTGGLFNLVRKQLSTWMGAHSNTALMDWERTDAFGDQVRRDSGLFSWGRRRRTRGTVSSGIPGISFRNGVLGGKRRRGDDLYRDQTKGKGKERRYKEINTNENKHTKKILLTEPGGPESRRAPSISDHSDSYTNRRVHA